MTTLRNINVEKLPSFHENEHFFKTGSYGSVNRILWQNKECAVKYFRKSDNYQKNYSEIYNLSICDHEHIVKLFGAGPSVSENKLHYYVMEFATNGSLDELLHSQKNVDYSLGQGLNWVYQCAKGVKYLHTNFPHPILHRDIKPANLLLFDQARLVKLCDFGTVKSVQNTENTAESGTFIYMAPEVMESQKDRKANYNEKCDIYSIAIIIWEILTRQKPFKNAPNVFSIINTVVFKNERLEEIPNCPPRLQKLIKCCWRKKYKERPNSSDVCKILGIILKNMDNISEPLPIKCYTENCVQTESLRDADNDENNVTCSREDFDVQMEIIDSKLKPNEPLPNNLESKMIFDQHNCLLKRYVHLNIECQKLQWENNKILNQIASDPDERSRIKRYCELKIKQEEQPSIQ